MFTEQTWGAFFHEEFFFLEDIGLSGIERTPRAFGKKMAWVLNKFLDVEILSTALIYGDGL